MRTALSLAIVGFALALSACQKSSDASNGSAPAGTSVAAVAAPKGTRWSETVAPTDAGGFVMGNPKAAIKVIEYGSYTCPHCRDFAKESDEPLKKDFVDTGKVSFEFRSFVRDPLDMSMALVARCGGKDIFFALKHELYANQDSFFATIQGKDAAIQAAMKLAPEKRFEGLAQLAGLIDFAKARGLPEPQLRVCLADVKTATAIAQGNDTATKQFNVQGTPTIIINGTPQENVVTWSQVEAKLREAGA